MAILVRDLALVNRLRAFPPSTVVVRIPVFYHGCMNWHDVWGVLKWFLAALVAGFIGQFGKSLALFLMRRRRSKRAESTKAHPSGVPSSTPEADVSRAQADAQAKIEKKRAKAEVKRLKKSGKS
jgi:hypothetical protein